MTDDRTIQPDHDPAAHYDHVTEAWQLLLGDELHYGVFETGDEPLAEATGALTALMVRHAQLDADGPLRVLDVGCGTGAPACQLVEDHGVEVLGITTSEIGVERARARATERGLPQATFEQRDGTANGLADASFDRVWVLESSHLMRDRDALVAECARVLRPGGRVVLCDLTRQREIPFLEVRRRTAEFATLREAFGDAHMLPLAYYRDAFESAGLVVDQFIDLTRPTLPTFDRWRANADQHSARVESLIGKDGLEAFVRSCDILETFWNDGTFGYGLVSARKDG